MNDNCRHDQGKVAELLNRYGSTDGESKKWERLVNAATKAGRMITDPVAVMVAWAVVLLSGLAIILSLPGGPMTLSEWAANQAFYASVASGYGYALLAMIGIALCGAVPLAVRDEDIEELVVFGMVVIPALFGGVMYVGLTEYPTDNTNYRASMVKRYLLQYEQAFEALDREGSEPTLGNAIEHGTFHPKHCDGALVDDDGAKHCLGDVTNLKGTFGEQYTIQPVTIDASHDAISEQEYELLVVDGTVLKVNDISDGTYERVRSRLRSAGSDLKPLGTSGEKSTGFFALPDVR